MKFTLKILMILSCLAALAAPLAYAQQIQENDRNRRFFGNAPVESERMQALSPEERRNDQTPATYSLLSRATGGRVHILHLSAASALPLIAAARAEGLRVTAETCPHYLTLDAAAIPAGATEFKCCPPIRDLSNQDLLWAGLAAGDVDMVVTDHSPSTADLKVPDFGHAWGGISSLQVGLAAVWTAARSRALAREPRRRGDRGAWLAAGTWHDGRAAVGARQPAGAVLRHLCVAGRAGHSRAVGAGRLDSR